MDAMNFFKRCFWELNICLDLWFSSLLDCIHFYVFFLSLSFIKLDSFSIDPWQIAIYRDPWTSFLDRSYCIFNPSKLFGFCLNSFSTDSLSIKKVFVWPIASRSLLDPLRPFCRWQILDSTSTDFIYRDLVLDKSSIHQVAISLNSFNVKSDFISLVLSWQKLSFQLLNTLFFVKTSYPFGFRLGFRQFCHAYTFIGTLEMFVKLSHKTIYPN